MVRNMVSCGEKLLGSMSYVWFEDSMGWACGRVLGVGATDFSCFIKAVVLHIFEKQYY